VHGHKRREWGQQRDGLQDLVLVRKPYLGHKEWRWAIACAHTNCANKERVTGWTNGRNSANGGGVGSYHGGREREGGEEGVSQTRSVWWLDAVALLVSSYETVIAGWEGAGVGMENDLDLGRSRVPMVRPGMERQRRAARTIVFDVVPRLFRGKYVAVDGMCGCQGGYKTMCRWATGKNASAHCGEGDIRREEGA